MSAPLGRLRLPWVDLPLFGLLLACAPVCALFEFPEQVGLGLGGGALLERAGGVSERCQTNREIRRSNDLLTAIRHELGRIFDRLGELFAAKIRQLRQRQARPEPAREPNWRYFEGDARRQLEADRADHTAANRGQKGSEPGTKRERTSK